MFGRILRSLLLFAAFVPSAGAQDLPWLEVTTPHFAGTDIPQDESRGAALLERAARDGLPEAEFQMGERTYGDGGNREHYVAAYVWYLLAQRGGFEQSQAKAAILAAEMSPEQMSEAQRRLDNWTTPSAK